MKNLLVAFCLLISTALFFNLSNAAYSPARLPPGVVSAFAGATCPQYSIEADGSSLLRAGKYEFLFAAIGTANGTADGTRFNIPDYRGRFLRGVDGTAGRDPDDASRTAMNTGGNTGDAVGSVQLDMYQSHAHNQYYISGGGGTQFGAAASLSTGGVQGSVLANGGNETRPKNAYVKFCIWY